MRKDSIHTHKNSSLFGGDVRNCGQRGLRLKVCGIKYADNIQAVAQLQPDYMGFIFYEKSPRYFSVEMPELPKNIKKTGVFVNASAEEIIQKIKKYNLQAVQLHGDENSAFCEDLSIALSAVEGSLPLEIIKVYSIKNEFDFSILKDFEPFVDYFLFDTKGKERGGNGYTFDWSVMKDYPSTKPYFLSGGIGLDEVEQLLSFLQSQESKYCHVIDVNSKFEDLPGLKNIDTLKKFITQLFPSIEEQNL